MVTYKGKEFKDEDLVEQYKIFLRFLKEKGLLSIYFKYCRTKECQNIRKHVPKYKNKTFLEIINERGFYNVISYMIIWDRTKEGYHFWKCLNDEHYRIMSEIYVSNYDKTGGITWHKKTT